MAVDHGIKRGSFMKRSFLSPSLDISYRSFFFVSKPFLFKVADLKKGE